MSSDGGEHNDDASTVGEDQETASVVDLKQEFILEASVDEVDEDEQSEESNRPGRYYGSDYNWRYHVQDAISVATALDEAENDDLSLHLYNAHAWKRNQYRTHNAVPSECLHSKQRWFQPNNDGTRPFLPPAKWTAWPLKPCDVPRSHERWGIPAVTPEEDIETYSRPKSWRPSLHLQEALTAVLLCKAKEVFLQRDWVSHGSDVKRSEDRLRSRQASATASVHASVAETATTPDSDEIETLEFSTENSGAIHASPTSSTDDSYAAVFMDDDQTAAEILQPTVRHILAKVDDVLVALHTSRLGHRTEAPFSRREHGSRSRFESRSRSRSTTSAAKDTRAVFEATMADDTDQSRSSPEPHGRTKDASASPQDVKRHYKRQNLGLRDWSEILGFAAMVGWNQTVVDRAAQRCATLFGESMSMRVMPETVAGQSRDRVVDYRPNLAPVVDTHFQGWDDTGNEHESDLSIIESTPRYPCPFSDCSRNMDPFEKLWRFREHLKRKHKQTDEDIVMLMKQIKGEGGDEAVDSSSEGSESGGSGFPCPYETCLRHHEPFEMRWRLHEHLKRSHKHALNKNEEAIRETSHESKANSMNNRTSQNSILQPITVKIGRAKNRHRRRRSATPGKVASKRRKKRSSDESAGTAEL